MLSRIPLVLLSSMLLLAGCASTPEPTGPPAYAPVISDLRQAPAMAEQVREDDKVRYFVSEEFFGPSLIEIFYREVALQGARLPTRKHLEVTEIEVSILVSGRSYLIDPTHDMLGRERARIAPALMVLDEGEQGQEQVVQVRIGYRVDGQPATASAQGTATGPEQARETASALYRAAIGHVIERLRQNG